MLDERLELLARQARLVELEVELQEADVGGVGQARAVLRGGGVEPGLAERWIVIDEGRSYIFRLRPAEWAGGGRVTAAQVATALRRRLRARANPLSPFLSAVDEVVDWAEEVSEVTCDVCGAPGRLRNTKGWYATRCDEHDGWRGWWCGVRAR